MIYFSPASIMNRVTTPVAEEKLPINDEYEFGSGKAALSLLFQVTSMMLILIPYLLISKMGTISRYVRGL